MAGTKAGEFHAKDKRKLPIFIHSELDDYGLSPVEFRTYARIARRAGGDSKLTESVPNMALVFGVAEVTVRRALQVLCMCGLISKKDRPGWTPEYTLNEHDRWRDKTELKVIREVILHPKSAAATLITTDGGSSADPDHQKRGGVITTDGAPSSLETDEGTPSKVLPKVTPITRAVGKPRAPNSDDEHDAKAPKFSITEMKKPPGDFYAAVEASVKEEVPELKIPFKEVYDVWWLKYDVRGGIGKRSGEKATLRQYHSAILGYCKTWAINDRSRQKQGASSQDEGPRFIPKQKTKAELEEQRRVGEEFQANIDRIEAKNGR